MLRAFEPEDAPAVEREVSRVEVARMMAVPHPYPKNAAEEWIATTEPGRDFAIVLRESGEVVGAITIEPSQQHKRASLGYWCAVSCWGRGYATEAVCAIIQYGFGVLALNRLHAECHGDKSGLASGAREGWDDIRRLSPAALLPAGRFADKLQFGILRDEWLRSLDH